MALGQKIALYRKKNNMTQKQLAEKLCVTPQAVSRWEKDVVEPGLDTIKKMVKILNISFDDLLSD